jgi:thiamine-monophosphate kinase
MDVSDGLVADLTKLCAASRVSADIEVAHVPLSLAAERVLEADCNLIQPILTGGEDYEILCAVPPDRVGAFDRDAAKAGVVATEIGRIVAGVGAPRFLNPEGQPLTFRHGGYSHF